MSFALQCMLSCLLIAQAEPQPDQSEADKEQIKRWTEYYAQSAGEFEMFLGPERLHKLVFRPQMILQYTNPIRVGQQHGAAFLWTHQGRPTVVGTIWSTLMPAGHRNVSHELHSLSEQPIAADWREARAWSTQQPGIERKPVPEAPQPAATAPARLTQMRALARGFTARIAKSQRVDEQELRLLPQPLYRYTSPEAQVLEGGLFTLVLGTDPEIFLLIEAVESAAGPAWHYGLARFTHVAAQVKYKDAEVWSCEKCQPYVRTNPYFLYWAVERRDATIEASPATESEGQP
jgi:hypothetical protein